MIDQFVPNQYCSGNINISVYSDRNQPHDGRCSELVVPIAVDNTMSPQSRSVTLPSIVHTETRSMERTVDQYTTGRLLHTKLINNSGTCFHRVTDVRYSKYSGLYQQAMVLLSDGRINEAIALLEEVSRELSDSHGVDYPLVRVAISFMVAMNVV